ncbi:glycyl radical protein [Chloroflexota bacterium]
MRKRIEQLKNKIFITPEICVERSCLITDAYKETEGMPTVLRRAKALRKILEEMTIYIKNNELIVGNMASKPRAAPLFPEFGVEFIRAELDSFAQRPHDKFLVSKENKKKTEEIISYWEGKTNCDRVRSLYEVVLPSEFKEGWDPARFQTSNEVIKSRAHADNGEGHVIPNYERLFKSGFNGIIRDIEVSLGKLNPANPQDLRRKIFLEAALIVCKAAIKFAQRYSDLARKLAAEEPERGVELRAIAEICSLVPANPARTFWEALQSLWFVHLIIQIESNGHAIGFGRLDQLLYPYYERDIRDGRRTREQALELIECLFIKSCEPNKLRPWEYTRRLSGYPMYQDVNLGGQTRDGKDATNELTYLFLEATEELRLHQPTINVRVHQGTPEELLVRACETLARHGNLPAFYSDAVIIPGLLKVFRRGGINMSIEDARDYAIVGCGEPVIPGKSLPIAGRNSHVNLSKILELALNNGVDPTTGIQLCPGDGDLTTFASFGDIMKAFKRQLECYLRFCPVLDNASAVIYEELIPTPFISSLIDYRIEIGKDVTEGDDGLNYTVMHIGLQGGPVNVANSLAALKKLVFEERKISGSELKSVLDNNFSGDGEKIRQMLLNRAPKYGNDNDYVDLLMKEILDWGYQEIKKYKTLRGVYAPHTQSLSANVDFGECVRATPDGRKATEPLADNISPYPGTDANGPTAVVKSAAKMDHEAFIDGNILNLKFHPLTIRGENGCRNLAALIRTYCCGLGGFQVQFNILSADVLREAMKHTQKYQDLIVKVAGYSAQFVLLDKKLQEQIISRTEHVFK